MLPRQPIKRRDSSRFYVVKDSDYDEYTELTTYSTLREIRESLNDIVTASRSVKSELLDSRGASDVSSNSSGEPDCSVHIENECARVSTVMFTQAL